MASLPAYAPTNTTSYTPSNNSTRYHEEISKSSLLKSNTHKTVYDSLAEIYSIITVLEVIENSFLKDYITDKEKYTSTALRLINQYQMLLKGFQNDDLKLQVLKTLLGPLADDLSNLIELLCRKFNLESYSLAIDRLTSGIPATIEHFHTHVESHHHPPPPTDSGNKASARLVAETTGNFITCMDAVKLNYRTKDQLHPLLSDLVISLNDLVTKGDDAQSENDDFKPIDFQGKSKLVNWLIKLNNLGDDKLSDDEADTFLLDLDTAYKGFYISLE